MRGLLMGDIDDEIKDGIDFFENCVQTANVSNAKEKARAFVGNLRQFLDVISVKLWDLKTNVVHGNSYLNAKDPALKEMKKRQDTKVISKLYDALSDSVGHSCRDDDQYLRLMLLYYPKLKKIRDLVKEKTGLLIFDSLEHFPYYTDDTLISYYRKIIESIRKGNRERVLTDKFYIEKQKPIIIDGNVIYELTLTSVSDVFNKFSRIIAFSHEYIPFRYLLSLQYCRHRIELYGYNVNVNEILGWDISIRPCEFNNLFSLILHPTDIQRSYGEYKNLMQYMKINNVDLLELVTLPDKEFKRFMLQISSGSENHKLAEGLVLCRSKISSNNVLSPVLRYLLYTLKNNIINDQKYGAEPNEKEMKNSNFSAKVYPFCLFPFALDLKNHRTNINTLYNCLEEVREEEKLYRYLKDNTEDNGILFTSEKDVMERFSSPDSLMNKFNGRNSNYESRHIKKHNGFYYIKGYENNTFEIVKRLKELSEDNNEIEDLQFDENAYNDILSQSNTPNNHQLSQDKIEMVKSLDTKRKVIVIQGPAGTGKTTLITAIAKIYSQNSILFLAQTHTAVNNLRWKLRNERRGYNFKTISSFINSDSQYDVLIIDECSTINNSDFVKLLSRKTFKMIVLSGDPFQIESIDFGNWFSLIKLFVRSDCFVALENNFRTENGDLLLLWNNIRQQTLMGYNDTIETKLKEGDKYQQVLITRKYSREIGKEIFDLKDDQIILTLNYDGLYGINNINHMLQSANSSKSVFWNNQEYKINDPVLFSDVNRFGSELYNNLKGRILDFEIDKLQSSISFTVEIDEFLDGFGSKQGYFILSNDLEKQKTVIQFIVTKGKEETYDERDDAQSTVPFQIAYAISIHKAQGLEFDNVKIIITDEIGEDISMNVFYTAITRAKKNLTIYWSQNTERYVVDNLKYKIDSKDYSMMKALHPELR